MSDVWNVLAEIAGQERSARGLLVDPKEEQWVQMQGTVIRESIGERRKFWFRMVNRAVNEVDKGWLFAVMAPNAESELNTAQDKWARTLLGVPPWKPAHLASWELGWQLSGFARAVLDVASRRARIQSWPRQDWYRQMFCEASSSPASWAARSSKLLQDWGIRDFSEGNMSLGVRAYKNYVKDALRDACLEKTRKALISSTAPCINNAFPSRMPRLTLQNIVLGEIGAGTPAESVDKPGQAILVAIGIFFAFSVQATLSEDGPSLVEVGQMLSELRQVLTRHLRRISLKGLQRVLASLDALECTAQYCEPGRLLDSFEWQRQFLHRHALSCGRQES
eukprot:s6491_g1.t1